ncbi:unnamed protein product [Miscanthus lutarioriparius]|uniref:TFIIS N-terminal domain-containing protein n=1 Tax=Miscanthus lutarioriparius TaxID=422564 RepID=A0A811QPZ8_9POAL|nr:unnamed protein product [Miscanthus lutarioriparius]
MDRGERLGRALDAFGGDLWALVDAALDVAARDCPDELRARRDGIVERLYAAAAAGCSNCAGRPPPLAALAAAGGWMKRAARRRLRLLQWWRLTPKPPEDELVRLLQNLADMDVTYNALQATDIGRQVNGLRKHPSAEVKRLVKQLIRKWKEIVDDWVRLHNSGGDGSATVMTADGDSPDKIQGRSHQSPRVSGFQYSPSPQRQKSDKEQRQSLLDLDKLDSARKRLQENYQEAQNAKKQRTIQVMDINDIPKPKTRNAFIRKSSSGGLGEALIT